MHQRAKDEKNEKEEEKPAVRADSFSGEDMKPEKEASSGEEQEQVAQSSNGSEDDDGNDSGGNRGRSTKGILPAEFEPEENAKLHDRQDDDDDSDAEARRHRNKRDADYQRIKRKSKKFRSFRKQGVAFA
ncbi:hypothetical protein ABMA27_001486 [Loxostege sticticalis]|uniref:Uncharacterized protein n=1 Tax=Loxostege sticticalis TaxID=481309 RepID=A0ABR3HYQ2_LOXSC